MSLFVTTNHHKSDSSYTKLSPVSNIRSCNSRRFWPVGELFLPLPLPLPLSIRLSNFFLWTRIIAWWRRVECITLKIWIFLVYIARWFDHRATKEWTPICAYGSFLIFRFAWLLSVMCYGHMRNSSKHLQTDKKKSSSNGWKIDMLNIVRLRLWPRHYSWNESKL